MKLTSIASFTVVSAFFISAVNGDAPSFLVEKDAEAKFEQLIVKGAEIETEKVLPSDQQLIVLARRENAESPYRGAKGLSERLDKTLKGFVVESIVAKDHEYSCGKVRTFWVGPGLFKLREAELTPMTGYLMERMLINAEWAWQWGAALSKPKYVCATRD